jgi:DNA-binding phage protein
MQSAGVEALARSKAKPPGPPRAMHEKLRALVNARKGGRSDTEIAAAAGMDRRAFSRILLGHVPDPKISTILRILDAIDADLCDLEHA